MATVRTASRSLAAPSSGVAKSSSSGSRLSFGTLTTYTGVRRPNNIDQASQPWSKGPQTLKEAVNKATRRVGKGPRTEARQVTRMMFERFTEKAIKVVMLAQEEARRLGHNFVGTEQILLGLIGESTGGLGVVARASPFPGVGGAAAGVEGGPHCCLPTALGHAAAVHARWTSVLRARAGMPRVHACVSPGRRGADAHVHDLWNLQRGKPSSCRSRLWGSSPAPGVPPSTPLNHPWYLLLLIAP